MAKRTDPHKQYSDWQILKRIMIQVRPFWFHIALVFLLGLLAAPLALLAPLPMKIVVDSVIGSDPLPNILANVIPLSIAPDQTRLLLFAVFMQIAIVLSVQLRSMVSYVIETYSGSRITLGFRKRLFGHIQRLSFAFHDQRGTSDSIYRIQYDTPSAQQIALYSIIPLISSFLTLIVMVFVIMHINLQLALVALTITPIVVIMSRGYTVRMRPRYTRVKMKESHVLGIIQEVLTGFRVVKAFGREESEAKRFEDHSLEAVDQRVKLSVVEGAFGILTNVTTALGTALVIYIGVKNVLLGKLTLGTLLMVISYLAQLYSPLSNVVNNIAGLQSALASSHRAFELMDENPDVAERPDAKPIDRVHGDVEYRNVSFSYDGKNDVLKNISFEIKRGSRVGIAGRTGAGKSTLVSLMPRFYDPSSGTVLIDGTDIREYKLADLRSQFSVVLQEPVLFATSIKENIAYADPSASETAIIEAAKAANAHDFIMELPDQYDTMVGERGMRLSGGERQRISLARAFLKDAPILLLDEPTSSVDTKTETLIMDAMELLMKGRTTFMIAHRLSTLEKCDVRIEIQDGKIQDLQRVPV